MKEDNLVQSTMNKDDLIESKIKSLLDVLVLGNISYKVLVEYVKEQISDAKNEGYFEGCSDSKSGY